MNKKVVSIEDYRKPANVGEIISLTTTGPLSKSEKARLRAYQRRKARKDLMSRHGVILK